MCDCIEKVNKLLEDKNTKLDVPIMYTIDKRFSADRVKIVTVKRDDKNRKKPIPVTPAYCPFCGNSYDAE